MARTPAVLSTGARLSDYLSLGVLSKAVPLPEVRAVLEATGRASQRQRELPAQVVVYYVIALALYMSASYREVLRCLLEGLVWRYGPGAKGQRGGEVEHLAGPHAVGLGGDEGAARPRGEAPGAAGDAGRLVPAVASGEPR